MEPLDLTLGRTDPADRQPVIVTEGGAPHVPGATPVLPALRAFEGLNRWFAGVPTGDDLAAMMRLVRLVFPSLDDAEAERMTDVELLAAVLFLRDGPPEEATPGEGSTAVAGSPGPSPGTRKPSRKTRKPSSTGSKRAT